MVIFNYIDPIAKFLGNWSIELNAGSIVLRLLFSFLLAAFIGAERSSKTRTAGLRTNILISVGACVVMLVNAYLTNEFESDAARLSASVITGIGFIGAGAIMVTSRSQVTGLTTAAALWICGCIGTALGAGQYLISLIAVVLSFISLILLSKLEIIIRHKSKGYELHIELLSRPDLKKLLDFVRSKDIYAKTISYDPSFANSGLSAYSIFFISNGKKDKFVSCNQLLEEISKLDYVHYAEIM